MLGHVIGSEPELVAAAEDRELPPVNAILPAEQIRTVYPITGDRLPDGSPVESSFPWLPAGIDTAEGTWIFDVLRPRNFVDEIHRRYIDDTTDMYGVRLPTTKAGSAAADRPG